MAIWLIGVKLYHIATGSAYREVTDQPMFYLALTAVIIGTQLFLAGFIGELVTRNATERNTYLIEKEIL